MTEATTWQEVVPPGEAALFERLASDLGAMQAGLGAKRGVQRALHAKPNLALRATFEVKRELTASFQVGPFAEPGRRYDAVVRFSNGGPVVQADRRPDVRGLAVKLLGVGGKKLIPGMEACVTQDFLAILSPAMPFRTPEDFVWFVLNARAPLTLLPKVFLRFGPRRALALLSTLRKGLSAPLAALHTNRYFSALPIRLGAHAAKYCFTPQGAQNTLTRAEDLGGELAAHLAQHDAAWDFQVQLFTDERHTPLEDPTVEWTTPWTTLGTLTVPRQSPRSPEGQQFAEWADGLSFDPWHACEELRPLGAMMRARNAAYRVSTRTRKASPEPTGLP
jgi:hypothetical protein